MELLKGLNKEQKEAVLHVNGPLLILAGAGSGKTRVLTYRIAYLVKEIGIQPENILAITFTNKAAKEMKGRVVRLVGGKEADSIWISTFHSACVRILRRDIDKLGFSSSFVIYDTDDQLSVVKECLKELNLSDKYFAPRSVVETIQRAKDELIEPEAFSNMYSSDFRMKQIAAIYKLYQDKLKAYNALDFGDIIMFTVKLFLDNPPVLKYYQKKFRYILVDEYQDTNTAQYALISLLSRESGNLCVVGDDDQGIYGWRGANIRNILEFEKEFKGCKVVKLEQNYRSTKNILEAANWIIRNNSGRKEKRLWTENIEGDKIKFFQAENEHGEAFFVASGIKDLIRSQGYGYKDFAVLYRINAQSRVIEDVFMKEGIPYKIVGGLKFYERREIKDVFAYLKVVQNPADNVSLKRIINVPRRGIGDATLRTAEGIAIEKSCSIFSVISSASEFPQLAKASSRLEPFVALINKFISYKESMGISELMERVLEESGLIEELREENTPESETRIENIRELMSVCMEFEDQSDDKSLEAFLAHVSLVSDVDSFDEGEDAVVLMTLHSAKGLEFPVVFMVGMEEGIFPGYRSMAEPDELEEERRLCYVGVTRAKERLFVTNTRYRTLFGSTAYNMASRFIQEIPDELLENADSLFNPMELRPVRKADYEDNGLYLGAVFSSPTLTKSKNPSRGTGTVPDFKPGDMVVHEKFGVGTIASVEEGEGDTMLEVRFKKAGTKRLLLSYARLVKIS